MMIVVFYVQGTGHLGQHADFRSSTVYGQEPTQQMRSSPSIHQAIARRRRQRDSLSATHAPQMETRSSFPAARQEFCEASTHKRFLDNGFE